MSDEQAPPADQDPPPPAADPPRLSSERPADAAREALARARSDAARRGLRRATPGGRREAGEDRPGRGMSGPGPDRRDPQPFGRAVRDLLRERGWEEQSQAASVVGNWALVVGPEVADHCTPDSLVGGVLVLTAESTAWATQLRLLAPRLLAQISASVGAGVVTSVRVHGPTAPSWQRGPRRVSGRGPRDTYG